MVSIALTPQGTPKYTILTPIALRSRYVTLTDRLITRLEGHDGWRPDDVIYLDKSGRPVAWLVRALWPVLARTPGTAYTDHAIPTPPVTHFTNIDREHWWTLTGATESGHINIDDIPATAITALRTTFLRQRPTSRPAHETPSWLDQRRILVVDEVSNTGDTLRIATGLIQRAFPTADVASDHWMSPGSTRDPGGLTRTANVPVWYRSDSWEGRLVGDRLDSRSPPTSWRNKAGALFQSTRPRPPDHKGRRLRAEINALAVEVAAGTLLATPSLARDEASIDDRIRALYGHTDPRAFTAARIAAEHDTSYRGIGPPG